MLAVLQFAAVGNSTEECDMDIIEAMKARHSVRSYTDQRIEGDVLAVTVRDTGIGISQDDLPHVFDRFYKADKSHGGKGTGLGLAIAYEIMKQLGETMTVESTLGEGSAFTFTLHIAKTES
jgi:signal transduction histidine kinase